MLHSLKEYKIEALGRATSAAGPADGAVLLSESPEHRLSAAELLSRLPQNRLVRRPEELPKADQTK